MNRNPLVLFFALLSAPAVFPQSGDIRDSMDMLPYTTKQLSEFDHIDLGSGVLGLNIPLLSYPQRGSLPPVSIYLTYNPQGWFGNCDDPSGACYPYHFAPISETWSPTGNHYPGVQVNFGPAIYGLMTATGDGTPETSDYSIGTSDQSAHSTELASSSTFATTDGTGIQLFFSPGVPYSSVTVKDDGGNTYRNINVQADPYEYVLPPTPLPTYPAAVPGTVTDPAGNVITYNVPGGSSSFTTSITDSVGRVIPLDPSRTNVPLIAGCHSVVYPGPENSPVTLQYCYSDVYVDADLGYIGDSTTWTGNQVLLTSVVLPNGQSWVFAYNAQGDLHAVTTPTGAVATYDYLPIDIDDGYSIGIVREIQMRTLDIHDGHPQIWHYAYGANTTVTDPTGNDTVHTLAYGGKDLAVYYYTGSSTATGAQPIKTVKTTYVESLPYAAPGYTYFGEPSTGALPKFVTTTLATSGGNITSAEYYCYDSNPSSAHSSYLNGVDPYPGLDPYPSHCGYVDSQNYLTWYHYYHPVVFGKQTAKFEFGFANGNSPGALVRQTHIQYKWQDPSTGGTYLAMGLLDTPSSVVVQDGNSTPGTFASTASSYDESTYSPVVCGKPTSSTSGLGTNTVTTHEYYNSNCMPWKSVDARNNATTITYDATHALFPTRVDEPTTGTIAHHDFYWYDFNTGEIKWHTDQNGAAPTGSEPNLIPDSAHTVSYIYDNMGRILSVSNPVGGKIQNCYADESSCSHAISSLSVETTTLSSPSPTVDTVIQFDQLGRPTRANLVSDPYGSVITDTTYDLMGRVNSVTNPYRSMPAPGDPPAGTTLYEYDGLGRTTKVTNPDGSTNYSWYNGIATDGHSNTTNHSGVANTTWTDVIDEAGHDSQLATDVLGHLVAAVEPDPSSGAPSLVTTYGYDLLGNLLNVNQVGKPGVTPTGFPIGDSEISKSRSFTYDSLSRLITATNPETGTICYGQWSGGNCIGGYDANGNVLHKTDASGMTLSYTYDALNRMLTKSAPDGMTNGTFYYDSGANGIGRMWAETMNGALGTIFSLDPMGRVTGTQWLSFPSYPSGIWETGMGAVYDLAGNITQLTYPDGRVVSQTWDGAGRLASVSDGPSGGSGAPYLSGLQYSPSGAVTSSTYGNSVVQNFVLNKRLQPCRSMAITPVLAANPGGGNLLDRVSFYSASSSSSCGNEAANNGNIYSIVDNRQPGLTQSFSYDNLNRLTTALRSDGVYNHTYHYDSFGNMLPQDNLHTTLNYSIDETTNRLLLNATDLQYNAAGEVTSAPNPLGGSHNLVYTAEGYLRTIDVGWGGSYLYNSLGERVNTNLNGAYWYQVVFLNGQPMADVDNNGRWTDYIYANGQKIARLGADTRFHLYGTVAQTGGEQGLGLTPPPGIMIQRNDRISWRQFNHNVVGGINVAFDDGEQTAWHIQAVDGQDMNQDSTEDQWLYRTADISDYTGKEITSVQLLKDVNTPVGDWSMEIADIAILHPDGSVVQIPVTGSATPACSSVSSDPIFCSSTMTYTAANDPTGSAGTVSATHYYLDDHLGTTQMELSAGGWPVWEGQFTPFGQEIIGGSTANSIGQQPADGTSMRYKFTGKERDAESGLDNFGARYYDSMIGRFTTPDYSETPDPVPYADSKAPQTLNLYSYAGGNPVTGIDTDGHITCAADRQEVSVTVLGQTTSFPQTVNGGNCHMDWTDVQNIVRSATDHIDSITHAVSNYITAPRDPGCMAVATAGGAAIGGGIGGVSGGASGAVVGSLFAPGPGSIGGGVVGAEGGAAGGAVLGGAGGYVVGWAACASSSGGGAANGGGGAASRSGGASGSSARLTRAQQRQTAKFLGMKEVNGATSQGQPVFEKSGRYFSFSNTSHAENEVFKELDRNGNRIATTDLNFNPIGR